MQSRVLTYLQKFYTDDKTIGILIALDYHVIFYTLMLLTCIYFFFAAIIKYYMFDVNIHWTFIIRRGGWKKIFYDK